MNRVIPMTNAWLLSEQIEHIQFNDLPEQFSQAILHSICAIQQIPAFTIQSNSRFHTFSKNPNLSIPSAKLKSPYIIHTDGSYQPQSGILGSAALIEHKNMSFTIQKRKEQTSKFGSILAELHAIQLGLFSIPNGAHVIVRTDSEYAIRILNSMKAGNKDDLKSILELTAEDADLMLKIYRHLQRLNLKIEKVPAHSNNESNNFVDRLAKRATKQIDSIVISASDNISQKVA